jgi:hypothetical protein
MAEAAGEALSLVALGKRVADYVDTILVALTNKFMDSEEFRGIVEDRLRASLGLRCSYATGFPMRNVEVEYGGVCVYHEDAVDSVRCEVSGSEVELVKVEAARKVVEVGGRTFYCLLYHEVLRVGG